MQGEKPQQGIVKETKRIAIGTVIMLIVMLVAYAVLGRFTIGVLLGGLLGSAYAIFNFFMLGMTLQKAASMTDQQMAHMKVRSSYSTRMVGMLVLAVRLCASVCGRHSVSNRVAFPARHDSCASVNRAD